MRVPTATLGQAPPPAAYPYSLNVSPAAQTPYWWQTGGQMVTTPLVVQVVATPQGTTAPAAVAAPAAPAAVAMPAASSAGPLAVLGPFGEQATAYVREHPMLVLGGLAGAVLVLRLLKGRRRR